MFLEIILLLALLALLTIFSRKPTRMPPGTFGWPILGELPPRSIPITEHLKNLKQKRGPIFTTKWGSHRIVVVTDYHLIKKAFNHPDIQGRPAFFSFALFSHFKNAGLVSSHGSVWSENRRFMLRHLRDLGMGKTALEGSIQQEAEMLVDHLDKTCVGKPAVMDHSINCAVVNVIWQMLASKRYDIEDKMMQRYSTLIEEDMNIIQGVLFILDVFPWLAKALPSFIMNKVFKVDVLCRNRDEAYSMFKQVIDDHMATLDPNNPRDVIDQLLLERAHRDAPDYLTPEDEIDVLSIIGDSFAAGSETTSSTLRWMILYMAINPEIQAKVHKRLDEVVPNDRLPSLNDRNQLQYVDAMLLEVMRLSSLVPIGLLHTATADVTFEGFEIPKGTSFMACSEMCHRNPAYWKHPDKFYPEHFLDDEGKLDGKKEGFLPFLIGRRQCLGESLARMELYLFSTAILQRFTIEPPEGVTLSTETNPSQMITNVPLPYKVVLKRRI
ncbi:Cytochrome P450 CYP3213A2 [Hyalella azteca]|uniref:Cytochrome P450 2L1 n=1 Tax=Hyalella azteca TaxID=294128 RepID=A0A6A0H818_HYAAZ|nr:cytochrome P450 2L1 [Hyalella azteca]KAA0201639.1 Cytochrome P450 CYP3213A2 [Hyalella azteca]